MPSFAWSETPLHANTIEALARSTLCLHILVDFWQPSLAWPEFSWPGTTSLNLRLTKWNTCTTSERISPSIPAHSTYSRPCRTSFYRRFMVLPSKSSFLSFNTTKICTSIYRKEERTHRHEFDHPKSHASRKTRHDSLGQGGVQSHDNFRSFDNRGSQINQGRNLNAKRCCKVVARGRRCIVRAWNGQQNSKLVWLFNDGIKEINRKGIRRIADQ